MLRAVVLTCLILAGPAIAQDREQTLADIRQELSVLFVEMQRLNRELSTTGSPQVALGGTSALERINAIEAELQRVTAKTEELENRINRVVADGTNRIGDLEFRLCELEAGCDIGQLGDTPTLGGEVGLPPVALPPIEPQAGQQLAVGEQADFDHAMEAYEAGSYESAVIQFATFTETYTGGPLTAEAHYWRGKALTALGNASGAARAYLESFSGAPDGAVAPDALLDLGLSLEKLGQIDEACIMLGEVTARFPETPASLDAQAARGQLACG